MTKEPTQSHRPALQKLTNDLAEMREELLAGFESRRAVLEWMQRLTIRTLGVLPDRWFLELAREFRGQPDTDGERVLLASLLASHARERVIDEAAVEDLRHRLIAVTIRPAYHRAFRELRTDATEFVDAEEGGVSGHDPNVQRYVAMRPALDELEGYQQDALAALLAGFDAQSEILDWGDDVELATHGEIEESFISRCYSERSTARMLLSDAQADRRARELFAAFYLLPAFNRGVRDLAGRAGEQPDAEVERSAPTPL